MDYVTESIIVAFSCTILKGASAVKCVPKNLVQGHKLANGITHATNENWAPVQL